METTGDRPVSRRACDQVRVRVPATSANLGPGFDAFGLALTLYDELIVTPVPRAPWDAQAEDALLRWAPTAGYRRVWLPERVVTFDGPPPLGQARVDCPSCGARWEDGSANFWDRVLSDGCFPGRCPACGGSLPEWSVITAADGAPCPRPIPTTRC